MCSEQGIETSRSGQRQPVLPRSICPFWRPVFLRPPDHAYLEITDSVTPFRFSIVRAPVSLQPFCTDRRGLRRSFGTVGSHPRDANPPQSKVRKLLSPLMQGMEFLISRLIAGSDRLTVGHQLFVGIGLVIFGCLPLLVGPTSDSGRWFWLAGAMCHNFSFWSIVAGIWFVLRSQLVGFKKLQPDLNQPSLVILTSAGRILAWLFMANVLGDALWLAACRDVISFAYMRCGLSCTLSR